jgi:O-antigen ligase
VNQTESFVEFFRYFTTLLTLIVLAILVSKNNNYNLIFYLFIFFSLIDVLGIYLQQRSGIPLIGFTANKNIVSASLILKSNAILFILHKFKNIYSKIFGFVFSFFVYGAVILIGSKAGILSSFIITIILLIASFIKKLNFRFSFIIPLGFVVSILTSNLFNNNFQTAVNDTINYANDTGSTDRLRYYSQAFETFSNNPLMGIGLGNWKIHSSKYDSIDMINYVVQYHTHNDYVQLLSEIGIGAVFYFLFIIFSFILIIKNLKRHYKENNSKQLVFLIICFLCMGVYFIDSNLNFPGARVVMQLNLASVIALILKFKEHEN